MNSRTAQGSAIAGHEAADLAGPIAYTARPSHLDAFSLNIIEDGDVTVISIVGDIDLRHSARVREALLGCVERAQTVIVDMAAVESIDSSGVAGFLEAGQTAKKAGRRFILAAVGKRSCA